MRIEERAALFVIGVALVTIGYVMARDVFEIVSFSEALGLVLVGSGLARVVRAVF